MLMPVRPVDSQHNDQSPRGSSQNVHVKHFGTIAGAKILLASYIGRSETGRNARKSTGRGGSKSGGSAFQAHCLALSGEQKASIKEVYTGDLGNAELL